MSSRRAAISSGLWTSLLLVLVAAALLGAQSLLSGAASVTQILAACNRLAIAAANDGQAIGWLGIIAIGFGILVMSDRRRRTKVRQASS